MTAQTDSRTRLVVEQLAGSRNRVHIAVDSRGKSEDNGLRLDVWLGADGRTLYMETYHWNGELEPAFVSTMTGELVDDKRPEPGFGPQRRPHPELAIIERQRQRRET